MPELPEVETTRRGILPLIQGKRVERIITRVASLRLPLDGPRLNRLRGAKLVDIDRRAKYLLFRFSAGWLLVHLGMSGSLRFYSRYHPPAAHDHVDIRFSDGSCLRLRDPRRFGLVLFLEDDPMGHALLIRCGPEPFSEEFSGLYLYRLSRGRRLQVHSFLLDQRIVAGLGNIYVNEALFVSGIDPQRRAGSISRKRYDTLVQAVRDVLGRALDAGGTTLRDFRDGVGKPGYFSLRLQVYGRGGEPCPRCLAILKEGRVHMRSIFYCRRCQK
ncbi:MAG: bifunctional DNA-formamidopyrimidine glycosylase/DNA-(apurinic or apyrimidinic site) lyase [Desulfuromonadaceae bacterium]|nr:bifunctional DNA-formamidopyrimidine glycosylase/DNA-(apurinic or apyrimidinic site) lyase [Desulfuromonadaceae bacterium]